ncbi:MAG: serine protease [Cocleimonas sp.]
MITLIQKSLLTLFLVSSLLIPAYAELDTSTLYTETEKSVYQIRVINKQTGKKSSIGSGFVVSKDNILATNYHVVSEYINDPDVYSLEYLSTNGKSGKLELIDFDIVHDLAIVKSKQAMGTPLKISFIPEKGASLFSLGNPMDLGFTIIKGTNNGVLPKAVDGNILFSGSLNPGMSGGPTLDKEGNIIGVNVATSGNDISFLVPAEYLKVVLERLETNSFKPVDDRFAHSSNQLRDNSKKILNKVLDNKWSGTRIGSFVVPAKLDKSIRCWDASRKPKKDDLFKSYFTRCSNEDNIFISSHLTVGSINYEYLWLETDKLSPARFYRRYEKSNSSVIGSRAGKRDVTNFSCHTDFTKVASRNFKTTVCRRDYLKYEGLSDMLFTTALVGEEDKGFIFNLDFTGTDAKTSLNLFKRMLETFKWQK